MAYNHLRGAGARRVGQGLAHNEALVRLDLQWNGFGDEDTLSALAAALRACGVADLNLAHNRIGLRGAAILAAALEAGTPVTSLVLDGNPIGQAR